MVLYTVDEVQFTQVISYPVDSATIKMACSSSLLRIKLYARNTKTNNNNTNLSEIVIYVAPDMVIGIGLGNGIGNTNIFSFLFFIVSCLL